MEVTSSEFWIFSQNAWTEINSTQFSPLEPPARSRSIMIRLPSDKVVVYSGLSVPNDVWTWNIASKVWTSVTPSNAGPTLLYRSGVYDALTDSMVIYVYSGSKLASYSFASNTWTNLPQGNVAPFEVTAHMSALSSNRVLYLVGTSSTTSKALIYFF